MSDYHCEISTDNTMAQDFFNRVLVLSCGFNHKEANRTFRRVAELDSDNPMAWWGAALVPGPNINGAMPGDNISRVW